MVVTGRRDNVATRVRPALEDNGTIDNEVMGHNSNFFSLYEVRLSEGRETAAQATKKA